VATINVLNDGDGMISEYNRNFSFWLKFSSEGVLFLSLYVLAMLRNIVIALGKVTVMDTPFVDKVWIFNEFLKCATQLTQKVP